MKIFWISAWLQYNTVLMQRDRGCILAPIITIILVCKPHHLYYPLLHVFLQICRLNNYTIYTEKYFSDGHFSYYSPCHYMRAWIRVLDAPGCYERDALQGSGLVRTVGPCAQRRVALMPRAMYNTAAHFKGRFWLVKPAKIGHVKGRGFGLGIGFCMEGFENSCGIVPQGWGLGTRL